VSEVPTPAPAGASPSAGVAGSPRVLVLSRNYPNDVLPHLGLWVGRMVRFAADSCDMTVVSPVPYCPPLPFLPENYARWRRVRRERRDGRVEVHHPRFIVPSGSRLQGLEAISYRAAVATLVRRLHAARPFDVIHAHFTFPDGWVAAQLGRRLGVPVIITEQAMWGPWMDPDSLMRRQALWAARQCAFHVAISTALRASIVRHTGESPKLRVIPDGVDGAVFTLPAPGHRPAASQVLFVGNIRHVKGVDVLLRAVPLLAARRPDVRVVLVGESFFASYRADYERMRRLAADLGITERVEFAGGKTDEEVVRYMQDSAVLVLPSRRESLGMVLAEALACGTPVVATRAGGPEDIVTPDVGVLVPTEDPEALAAGIADVLDTRQRFDPVRLREHALERFGLEAVHRQVAALYAEAVRSAGSGGYTPRR
jgi:glycosyltransferase involved in cell wall biosynthesis